jgi:sensor histidine kinase YesM
VNHPFLNRRASLGAYLLVWLPVGVLVAVPVLSLGWSWFHALALTLPVVVLGAGVCLSPYYLCRAYNPEVRPFREVFAVWAVASLVVSALWGGGVWLAAQVLVQLPGMSSLPGKVLAALPFLWVFMALLYLASAAFHYLLLAQERAREAERERLRLRMLAQDAELKALRAQINPHFLFNSLNSLSALTSLDPAKARTMCVRLSDFLRLTLGLGERSSVPLREEFDLLRTYLDIEQVRFGARLQVRWEVEESVLEHPLPPLLLQPLVENAIKHGIGRLPEGGELLLTAAMVEGELALGIANPRDPEEAPAKGLGLGLRAVRERLEGRYGSRARFSVEATPERHVVRIRIPMEEPS